MKMEEAPLPGDGSEGAGEGSCGAPAGRGAEEGRGGGAREGAEARRHGLCCRGRGGEGSELAAERGGEAVWFFF